MAPRKTDTAPAAPAPTASASTVTKTVQGFAIGLTAFIPIDPKDFRKQAEIPMLLLDIQEGRKTIADLAGHLKQVEFRAQNTRKRVTADEYEELFRAPPASNDEQTETEETEQTEEDPERPGWTPPGSDDTADEE